MNTHVRIGAGALVLVACDPGAGNSVAHTPASEADGAAAGGVSTSQDGSAESTVPEAGTSAPEQDAAVVIAHCTGTPKSMPSSPAPTLTPGTWVNISAKSVPFGGDDGTNAGDHVYAQGLAVDPCNPAVLYQTVSGFNGTNNTVEPSGGLYKTTNAGSTWTKIGPMDEPINIRIDPGNSQHLYAGDGVRGNTSGFWVSNDGGATWAIPAGFASAAKTVSCNDVYHVSPDPANFNHVLVSFHNPWNNGNVVGDGGTLTAGVLESFDGGNTWTIHNPPAGWSGAYGYDVFFLSNPALGIGDGKTWLYGTQGKGYWRTADAGQTWTQVSTNDMKHGGSQTYYTASGTLYVGGSPNILQSSDNGLTFKGVTPVPSQGFIGITGDGTTLYTGATTTGPMLTSTDGVAWHSFNSQQFNDGPFELSYDATDRIVYAAIWLGGTWALQLN